MKPLKDYSHIKGFNYSLASLEKYDHEIECRNMGYAKRLTLNSCRLFMKMDDWKKDPQAFLANLKDFMQTAWEAGITTTPILLMPYFTEGQTPYWMSEDHSCSPIPGCYFEENWEIGERYVADIIEAVADHPGLLFWDVMNEPSWHGFLLSVDDEEERNRRYELVWKFVRHFITFVRSKDPVNALGVGHTFIEDTEYSKTGDMVDIIIFHDYLETRSRVEATCRRALELSEKYGKPVINNETGCLCRSNPYDMAVEMADKSLKMAREALEKKGSAEELLEAAEYVANLLEAGELVPMAAPPTAKIAAYRRMEKKDLKSIRSFLYTLMQQLKDACEIP